MMSKHQGIIFHTTFPYIKLLSIDHAVLYLLYCYLMSYYLMSFLSELLSPLWSQQQLSTLLPAVAVVTLPLQAVAWVFAVVTLPLQAVAGVLDAVVLLLFEPAVAVVTLPLHAVA
jgi:hypothetical protein